MQNSPIVRFVISSIALPLLLGWPAAGADKPQFRAGPANSYAHQTADGITVGAQAFDKPDLVESAFGKKLDLLRYGVLPVLVVVENKGKTAIDLQALQVSLVASDGRHAQAVEPDELYQLGRPKPKTSVTPLPVPLPAKKNRLLSPELVTRSFIVKMLPPGDSASGFFYFEAQAEQGDKLYLNGMRDARSGQDVFYFEFPLAGGPAQ